MSNFNPTDIQKANIKKDIQGEIDIFVACYKKLLEFGETRESLECFLLHARTLFDFLVTSERYKHDVIATDFIQESIKLDDFPIEKERIDQQLVHISYDRLEPRHANLFISIDGIYKSIINGLDEFNKKASEEHRLVF